MSSKATVRELARMALGFCECRGYGLGEIAFNVNHWALEEIGECDAYVNSEEMIDAPITKEEYKCSLGEQEHESHIYQAKSLAREALEIAEKLEDMGVTSFN